MARKRQRTRERQPTPIGISHTARGAVLIKFPDKPSDGIRKELRRAGFHFNRAKYAWRHKSTEANERLAAEAWEAFQVEFEEESYD